MADGTTPTPKRPRKPAPCEVAAPCEGCGSNAYLTERGRCAFCDAPVLSACDACGAWVEKLGEFDCCDECTPACSLCGCDMPHGESGACPDCRADEEQNDDFGDNGRPALWEVRR